MPTIIFRKETYVEVTFEFAININEKTKNKEFTFLTNNERNKMTYTPTSGHRHIYSSKKAFICRRNINDERMFVFPDDKIFILKELITPHPQLKELDPTREFKFRMPGIKDSPIYISQTNLIPIPKAYICLNTDTMQCEMIPEDYHVELIK